VRRERLLVWMGLAILATSTPYEVASARVAPATKCAVLKVRAAIRKAGAEGSCRERALAKGTPVDPACLTKAEFKFDTAMGKADAAGTCPGTAAQLEAQVDAFVGTLVDTVEPGTTTTTTPATTTTSTTLATGLPAIFTIVLEDHDYNEVVGSSNAPYINSLIDRYGLATNYLDVGHPSLPNYLYLVSGQTQYPGGVDLDPTTSPYFPADAENLGSQLENAGISWRSYQEDAGGPCNLSSSGLYTARHDPFLYFTDIQQGANDLCAARNVDYSNFATDLAAGTYKFMWITPNLNDDGHDPATDSLTSLRQSDQWLSTEVPKILGSEVYTTGGMLFITWDEAEGRSGDDPDQVPMIVISPRLRSAGYRSSTPFSHASWLATVEQLYGLPKLGGAATASDLTEFFAP
jgi:hypothetical protein